MSSYCILGCSPKERSKPVHRFPSPLYPKIYHAWLQVIPSKLDKKNFDYRKYRVCDRHFEPEAKYPGSSRLKRSAVPTLHLPNSVAHDGCDSPREFVCHKIDGEVKELIKYEHSYAAPRSSNGELQKEDTIVDETSLNTYENGVDKTQIVLTKLIESYNIEEICYSDAEQLLSHLDIAEVTEIASTAENKENIASQNQNKIRKTVQKSENIISNHNLSSCDDLLSDKEECQNINTKNLVNPATTKYPENIIITSQMQHVLDDANVNKVNISSAGFKRKRNLIESYNIEEICYSDAEQLLSHLDIAEVTEIARTAENKENIVSRDQNEIRKTLHKSEDISDCNLSSCNDLSSDKEECQNINTKKSVSTATTKYPENIIITSQMQHVLDDANVNKVNISSAGFKRKRNLIESYNIEEICYSDAEQLLSHLDIAEVTEIARTAENKENIVSRDQNEIRKTLHKSEDISDCNLSSCNDLSSDKEECQNINTKKSVSTATTKYTENIKSGQMMHHVLDDANANKVNKSCAGFRRNRKYLYYRIQPKSGRFAIISKQEISKINTLRKNRSIKAYICFDKYYVFKESQANLNQMKPLLINSMSSFNTQSNSPYKQSVSFDFALFKYRDKVLNASLLLNLENKDHSSLKFGGYNANDLHQLGGKHSLQQSGCNTHVNSIGEESVREICEQANPESRSIANDELCLSDIHTVDNRIQLPLCTSPDRHVSVRIYEENCVNPAGPVSPKPAKLHVSELDVDVGSTTFVSGGFEPNDDEPVEDPLAIHSPDLGMRDSGALNEDSMPCSVENNMSIIKDNMSNAEDNISNFEGNISDAEDNVSIIKDNMSNAEDNISNVEGNISDVEDNMSIIKDNMRNAEDNISNVEGNISDVEDNMSIIKDNMSNAEDNISNIEGNISAVEDNISNVEDNVSIIEINMGNIKDNISNVGNISNVEDNMSIIEINMGNIEDNISNVDGNISDVDDNMSIIEINMSNIEDNISNVEGNISDVEDNMSIIEINRSNIEDNISNVEGNLSDVEDNTSIVENMSTEKDNMSYKKDTRHLVDRLDSINSDSKHCIDDFVHREECNDDLDLRLEIAFALKFMYKKDKTPKEAVEEIIETYGKGKLTLKEAKCWYHEFKLGNNIMRIISSGGPVYK